MRARNTLVFMGVTVNDGTPYAGYVYGGKASITVSAGKASFLEDIILDEGKLNVVVSVQKNEMHYIKDMNYVLRKVGIDPDMPYHETEFNSGITVNKHMIHYYEQVRNIEDVPKILLPDSRRSLTLNSGLFGIPS